MAARGTKRTRSGWRAVAFAGALTLAACAETPETAPPLADDPAIVPLFEQGLRHVVASGDPLAIGALVGAHPDAGVSIVEAAVSAHPQAAAGIAAAAAAEQPDLAPDLAAAAAANPAAAAEIVRRTAVAVPDQQAAIADAVLAALLPDDRLVLAAPIAAALDAATPPSVDQWAGAPPPRP
jgi:hypothetical protein